MTVAHALTVAVMAVVVCGMLWPLLTSTWGMS
jgi:K+-transporting ATPase c subunit